MNEKAIIAITTIITIWLTPETYDPLPIFPAARPPKTASTIAILNKIEFIYLNSKFASELNIPALESVILS